MSDVPDRLYRRMNRVAQTMEAVAQREGAIRPVQVVHMLDAVTAACIEVFDAAYKRGDLVPV